MNDKIRIRKAEIKDIPGIQTLAITNNIMATDPETARTEGSTVAIYKDSVLEHILEEGLSQIMVDEHNTVRGYFLLCSQPVFHRAFGVSLKDELSMYNCALEPNAAYGVQVCLDRQIRGEGYYTAFHNATLQHAAHKNISAVYAEILEYNQRSRAVHTRLGWEHVGTRTVSSIYDFKGNDLEKFDTMKKYEVKFAIVWTLYKKEIESQYSMKERL